MIRACVYGICAGILSWSMPLHAQLQVIERVATRGAPEAPFGSISDMVDTDDGWIVIADDVSGMLHVWDPRTNDFAITARSGDGPGEVRVPTRMARRPDGGFAVYDVSRSRVLFFDSQRQPEHVTVIPGIVSNPKSLAIDASGHIWIAGGRLTDPRSLHRFTSEGRRVEAFGEPPPGLRSDVVKISLAGGALRPLPSDEMLFSFGTPLRILSFRGDSMATGRVVVEDPQILPSVVEEEVSLPYEGNPRARIIRWWHDRSTGVFGLWDGGYLNVITRFYGGDSVWDVYGADGLLKERSLVHHAYFALHPSRDGGS